MREKNRMLWRCRQGTRELELLLSSYVEQHYESLTETDRQAFQSLLEFSNTQLNDWLLYGANTYADRFASVIHNIRSFNPASNG